MYKIRKIAKITIAFLLSLIVFVIAAIAYYYTESTLIGILGVLATFSVPYNLYEWIERK